MYADMLHAKRPCCMGDNNYKRGSTAAMALLENSYKNGRAFNEVDLGRVAASGSIYRWIIVQFMLYVWSSSGSTPPARLVSSTNNDEIGRVLGTSSRVGNLRQE
eukprot:1651479-Pyramimonas_sp.AAC.1